jgi:hypothetical protein
MVSPLARLGLRLASDKANDVTIKRLAGNNPTMADKFAEQVRDE